MSTCQFRCDTAKDENEPSDPSSLVVGDHCQIRSAISIQVANCHKGRVGAHAVFRVLRETLCVVQEDCQAHIQRWEPHLMVEFGKANDVASAATALVIETNSCQEPPGNWACDRSGVGTIPSTGHHEAVGPGANRGLQIVHQGDLPFRFVEKLTIHGLLTSDVRIRQAAIRSKARMEGDWRRRPAIDPVFSHTLSMRLCAHCRSVQGSGERSGSIQSGAACSIDSPDPIRSQACCGNQACSNSKEATSPARS